MNLENNTEDSNEPKMHPMLISQETIGPNLFAKIAKGDKLNYCHKFMFKNAIKLKNKRLKARLVKFLHPVKLKPFEIIAEDQDKIFYAKNCYKAVEKCIKNGLTIPSMGKGQEAIKLDMVVNFSKLDPEKLEKIPVIQAGVSIRKGDSFLISQENVTLKLMPRIRTECSGCLYWHRFILTNIPGGYDKDSLMKIICDFLLPAQIKPVNIACNNTTASFLATDCLGAVSICIKEGFRIPVADIEKKTIEVRIVVNFAPIDTFDVHLEDNIRKVLQNRLRETTLDLTEFHNDVDLKGICKLNNKKSLMFIVHFLINLTPSKIILAKNAIKNLRPLSFLDVENLTVIDLQQNQITSFTDLLPLTKFKLKELNLNENPICSGIHKIKYLKKLRGLFPLLNVIDDKNISKIVLNTQNNFLCCPEAGDVAEQFLEYFFTMYDKDDRSQLSDLYHKHAVFSLTCKLIPSQKSSIFANFNHYFAVNRNLRLRGNDLDSTGKLLFHGRKNIINLFKSWPKSHHDPYQIKTDVIYYSNQRAILVFNGLFQEKSRYFGFSRNFILECNEKEEYCIKNEQLHVYNATNSQVANGFMKPPKLEFTGVPTPTLQVHYSELHRVLQLITNLNERYCIRFLEKFNYDLKTTLKNFIDLHVHNKIPQDAFISEQCPETSLHKAQGDSYSKELIDKILNNKEQCTTNSVWEVLDEILGNNSSEIKD